MAGSSSGDGGGDDEKDRQVSFAGGKSALTATGPGLLTCMRVQLLLLVLLLVLQTRQSGWQGDRKAHADDVLCCCKGGGRGISTAKGGRQTKLGGGRE